MKNKSSFTLIQILGVIAVVSCFIATSLIELMVIIAIIGGIMSMIKQIKYEK